MTKNLLLNILCCLGLLLLQAGMARAETFQLPEGSVDFTPPQGYCLMEPGAYESDNIFITQLRTFLHTKSTVLAVIGDCKALEDFRAGTRPFLIRYGVLAAIKMQGQLVKIPGATRQQFLNMIEEQLAALDWQEMRRSVNETYHGIGAPLRAGEIKPLGVIDADDNAVYAGFFANYGTSDRLSYWGANVMATTLIDEYPISFNLYAEYRGDQSFDWLMEQQKSIIPAMVGENDTRPTFGEEDIIYLVIAMVLSILILFWKKMGNTAGQKDDDEEEFPGSQV